jgi:hypothetical protein
VTVADRLAAAGAGKRRVLPVDLDELRPLLAKYHLGDVLQLAALGSGRPPENRAKTPPAPAVTDHLRQGVVRRPRRTFPASRVASPTMTGAVQSEPLTVGAPVRPRWQLYVAVGLFAWVAVLLFARLGHYPLWDDEAVTAIVGDGVWRTGDTSVVHGQNIMGYESGAPLRGLYEKFLPPLQFYVVAPFIGLLGDTAFVARLPFALAGLASVGVLLYWLWRDRASTDVWVLFGIALATAVPLFLYLRQSRYFALATLLTVAIAYVYLHRPAARRSRSVALGVLLALLMLSNYISYFATAFALLVDYAVWGRRERKLRLSDWAVIAAFQLVTGLWILWTRNPLLVRPSHHQVRSNAIADKLRLAWYSFRDLNANEMMVAIAIFAVPVVWWLTRDKWLLRSLACLLAYLLAAGATMPTKVQGETIGEVRYLAPLILLCLWIEVLLLRHVWKYSAVAAVIAAALMFGTNVLNRPLPTVSWIEPRREVRSTFLAYLGELARPPTDPYTPTIRWVDGHVLPGQSIWMAPMNTSLPLMFHQPKAVYAWQFGSDRGRDVPELPPIHTFGQVPVDYVISWGTRRPTVQLVFEHLAANGIRYERVGVLDVFGADRYRPEILWRIFREPPGPVAPEDMIYIYKRVGAPMATDVTPASTAPSPPPRAP